MKRREIEIRREELEAQKRSDESMLQALIALAKKD